MKSRSWVHSEKPENQSKNRYGNIVACKYHLTLLTSALLLLCDKGFAIQHRASLKITASHQTNVRQILHFDWWKFSLAWQVDRKQSETNLKLHLVGHRWDYTVTIVSWCQLTLQSFSGIANDKTVCVTIAQFQYFNIQLETKDITTTLRGINHINLLYHSPKPRCDVFCFKLNFNNYIEIGLFCV